MSRPIFYNGMYKPLAQELRRNMTKQERHLWYDFLKQHSLTFRRQKQFGPYIVDFYCAKAKLVIELDGSQHFEEKGKLEDRERDEYLSRYGLKVLRFSNAEVDRNFWAVCEMIDREIGMIDK